MAGILRTDTIQNSNTSTIITQTNSTTITIGTSGQTVALASGASSSGFGRSGTVDWDTTKKTTGFTAVNGVGYFCDTTSSAFTATLPSSPTAGNIVSIADYNGTAETNNITVGRNSSNIDGSAVNFTININYASITFIYVDATVGWRSVDTSNRDNAFANNYVVATGGTILTCGDYKTHVFTGPGTFTVTNAGAPTGSNSVEYIVVAGGAGGGGGPPGCNGRGGGGGAGGFRQNYPSPTTTGLPVTVQGYPITVGGGGAGGTNPTIGVNGSPSIFSTITSSGGGGGGSGPNNRTGASGGSGGGGATYSGGFPEGSGNTPPTSPPQGNPGGGGTESPPNYGAGGGGGAGAPGGGGDANNGGDGGVGSPIATTVFGPTAPTYGTPGPAPGRYFAGGGGGAIYTLPIAPSGDGGAGGGGKGGSDNGNNPGRIAGVSGTTNTGGGGGGSANQTTGGAGGSGIVIIRYKYQ